MRVHSVQVFVSDMERSVAFYRDVLGLPVRVSTPFLTEFDLEGLNFGLQYMDKQYMGSGVSITVDFEVDDIAAKVEELKGKGVEFTAIVLDQPYAKLAKFRDPDGHLLGLFELSDE